VTLVFWHGEQDWLQKLSRKKGVEQRDVTASEQLRQERLDGGRSVL
jgi:hypothetical protein